MIGVHELSIADALATQVLRYAPATGRVQEVEIMVGALRGIEPEAMQMCWEAVTNGTVLAGSSLVIDLRPWQLTCPTCGRVWGSPVPFADCECGEPAPRPAATDELDLVSLTVDEDGGVRNDDARAVAAGPAPTPAAERGSGTT